MIYEEAPAPAPALAETPPGADDENSRRAKTIASIALWLWSFSLFLPALQSDAESMFGLLVLISGSLFGWISPGGWAVYANYFFLFAVTQLVRGKVVMASPIATILLGAFTVFFPATTWGWGAVLWIMALLMTGVAAAVRLGALGRRASGALLILIGGIAVAAGLNRIVTLPAFNIKERQAYFSGGMVLTHYEPCGIELNMPERALITQQDAVRLDIDPELRQESDARPALRLPPTERYEQDGYLWTNHNYQIWGSDRLRVGTKPLGNGPILQARATPDGALIKLLSPDAATVLYEQRLRIKRGLDKKPEYCPAAIRAFGNPVQPGYEYALELAYGYEPQTSFRRPGLAALHAESSTTVCNPSAPAGGDPMGVRQIDGKVFAADFPADVLGFCSEHYIAIVDVAPKSARKPSINLYDRPTMKPVGSFYGPECLEANRCLPIARDTISAIRIESNEVVVRTSQGEVRASGDGVTGLRPY